MPLPADVVEYCRIHALKMEDEGWHKTSIVLDEAANEIEKLREVIRKLKGENHEDQCTCNVG